VCDFRNLVNEEVLGHCGEVGGCCAKRKRKFNSLNIITLHYTFLLWKHEPSSKGTEEETGLLA